MKNKIEKISKEKIKTWLVTGASSGIGAETCKQLISKGYNVVAISRRKTYFKEENVLSFCADVTDEKEVNEAINRGIEKFGSIDVLFNSAGISSYGTFEEETPEEMHKVMDVNFWGTYNTIKKLLPHFRENKNGTIINISSEMGLFPRAYGVAYCASKYAVEGLSSSLWWETKSFCRVITVELDKFDGTEIGAGKKKGVSNIEEYKNLVWIPHKAYTFPQYPNNLETAISYIIAEVEKQVPARRLLLGKTICINVSQELNSIKNDIKNSMFSAFNCASIDIKKLTREKFKYKLLTIFTKNINKKEQYKSIYNTIKYIEDNF